MQVSWLDPHKIRRLTIVGSEKMAVFDDMESAEKIRIYDKSAERRGFVSYGDAITLRFGDVVREIGLDFNHGRNAGWDPDTRQFVLFDY